MAHLAARRFLMTALLIFSGCAQFRLNQLPRVQSFPPLPANTPPIAVSYTLEPNAPDVSAKLEEALMESGYFSTIFPYPRTDTLHIRGSLRSRTTAFVALPFNAITGITLGIIPSWYTDTLDLQAVITRPDNLPRIYSYSDGVRHFFGLVVLPITFSHPHFDISVLEDVGENMFRCMILDMYRDGLLH